MIKPLDLTPDTFEPFIQEHSITVIDFWAEWCRPCHKMHPILDDLSRVFQDRILVGKVNVDDHRSLVTKYGATSIPTFWVFFDGEPVERYTGLYPKQEFAKIFQGLLRKYKELAV